MLTHTNHTNDISFINSNITTQSDVTTIRSMPFCRNSETAYTWVPFFLISESMDSTFGQFIFHQNSDCEKDIEKNSSKLFPSDFYNFLKELPSSDPLVMLILDKMNFESVCLSALAGGGLWDTEIGNKILAFLNKIYPNEFKKLSDELKNLLPSTTKTLEYKIPPFKATLRKINQWLIINSQKRLTKKLSFKALEEELNLFSEIDYLRPDIPNFSDFSQKDLKIDGYDQRRRIGQHWLINPMEEMGYKLLFPKETNGLCGGYAIMAGLAGLLGKKAISDFINRIYPLLLYDIYKLNGYDLKLMSSLLDENGDININKAVEGRIYLSDEGKYIVRDPNGIVQEGIFDKNLIPKCGLANSLKDKQFLRAILEITSQEGHTQLNDFPLSLQENYHYFFNPLALAQGPQFFNPEYLNGYELILMSENDFESERHQEKYKDKYQDKPILIQTKEGGYKLWGFKNGQWQLTTIETTKLIISKEYIFNGTIVRIDTANKNFSTLEEGHTHLKNDEDKKKDKEHREKYQGLFESKKKPLWQRDIQSHLIISKELEEKGGLIIDYGNKKEYTQKELVDYLTSIKKKYEGQQKTVSFYLSSGAHGICLIYNPLEEEWFVLDVNYTPGITKNIDQVAVWIKEAATFIKNNKISFETWTLSCGDKLTAQLQRLLNRAVDTEEAMILVSLGAEATVMNNNGRTLLHILTDTENNKNGRNNNAIEKLVTTYKVDINIKDKEGKTALQRLISGKFYIRDAMVLVRLGADATVMNKYGRTLLDILADPKNNQNGCNNLIIEELVTAYNLRIEIKDKDGKTLQHLISGAFDTEDAMALVRLGADATVMNNNGQTLLHILADPKNNKNGRNNNAIEKLVTTYKVDINIKDKEGKTALQRLISGKFYPRDAMVLVRLGADATVMNKYGRTLLDILADPKNNQNGCNNETIEELVKIYNLRTEIKDKDGKTLQCLISGAFDTEEAMALVRLGADATVRNKYGCTLLHILAKNNKNGRNIKAIKELVNTYNVGINIEDKEGKAALQYLISGEFDTEDAMALVRLGADVTVMNNNGQTLLHILAETKNNKNGRNNKAIEELVKTYNVEIDIKDKEGKTAFQSFLAKEEINYLDKKQIEFFLSLGAKSDEFSEEEKRCLSRWINIFMVIENLNITNKKNPYKNSSTGLLLGSINKCNLKKKKEVMGIVARAHSWLQDGHRNSPRWVEVNKVYETLQRHAYKFHENDKNIKEDAEKSIAALKQFIEDKYKEVPCKDVDIKWIYKQLTNKDKSAYEKLLIIKNYAHQREKNNPVLYFGTSLSSTSSFLLSLIRHFDFSPEAQNNEDHQKIFLFLGSG